MDNSKTTLPLHIKSDRNIYVPRSDEMAVLPDHLRRPSKMSKRRNGYTKNGNGHCHENANTALIATYYKKSEATTTLSSPSREQSEGKRNRRKSNKGCCQVIYKRNKLLLMMVVLVGISCSFSIHFTVSLLPYYNDNLIHPMYAAMNAYLSRNDQNNCDENRVRRSKDDLPRIIKLGLCNFVDSSNIHETYHYSKIENFAVPVSITLVANSSETTENGVSFEIVNSNENSIPQPVAKPEAKPEVDPANKDEKKNCLPMAKWMTASYPNCNSVHEIDMHQGVFSKTYDDDEDLQFLGQGWFRDTWKYANENFDDWPPVVIKTLRIEREFLDEYFDLHRRDAIAMERLTFSPYVLNVHGYCGQSAINELADGALGGKVTRLEQLTRLLRGKESIPQVLLLKLKLASKIAIGLAHIHNIHVSDNSGGRSKSIQSLLYEHTSPNSTFSTTGFGRSVPTMAHYDINPRNIAIMSDGSAKLNDFNTAEFLTYDPETNQTCGFRSRLHEPWWRAPEEVTLGDQIVDEKVDIYALGEVLFHILTTHSPRGKMKKERMEEVREVVKQGIRPTMWEPYASGGEDGSLKKDPIVKAFMKAMDLCFEKEPEKRGTSIQVARVLHKALMKEVARQEEESEA